MGVSEVVMAIIEKKLPLVGHNGLHDLMYLYHYFIANLPGEKVLFTMFPMFSLSPLIFARLFTHVCPWRDTASTQSRGQTLKKLNWDLD